MSKFTDLIKKNEMTAKQQSSALASMKVFSPLMVLSNKLDKPIDNLVEEATRIGDGILKTLKGESIEPTPNWLRIQAMQFAVSLMEKNNDIMDVIAFVKIFKENKFNSGSVQFDNDGNHEDMKKMALLKAVFGLNKLMNNPWKFWKNEEQIKDLSKLPKELATYSDKLVKEWFPLPSEVTDGAIRSQAMAYCSIVDKVFNLALNEYTMQGRMALSEFNDIKSKRENKIPEVQIAAKVQQIKQKWGNININERVLADVDILMSSIGQSCGLVKSHNEEKQANDKVENVDVEEIKRDQIENRLF